MRFAYHEHQPGLNTTVRLGTKWRTLMPGQDIVLTGVGGERPQTARVKWVYVCQLYKVPPAMLALEHDPEVRTPEGLERVLTNAYGHTIGAREVVTVVDYWPREV